MKINETYDPDEILRDIADESCSEDETDEIKELDLGNESDLKVNLDDLAGDTCETEYLWE